MSNLTEIRYRVDKLKRLLDDPHPGLSAWREAYGRASQSVLEFYGIDVDKIKQETRDLAVEQTIGDMERAKTTPSYSTYIFGRDNLEVNRAQRKPLFDPALKCNHGGEAQVDIFHWSGACMLPQDPPTLAGPPIEVCPQCGSKSKEFRGCVDGDWCKNIWHLC